MANSIGAPCVFYRPSACTKHNIEAHCGNDCTRCVDRAAAADAAAAPTCGQLIDMYQVAARKLWHSKLTISGVTQRYRKLVRDAGVSLDAKYGALTTAAMEAAADGWSSKGTSVATIGGLLAAAKSVTGRHVLKEYAKRVVTISPYVLPDHKQAKTHYLTLPRSVLFEINEWRLWKKFNSALRERIPAFRETYKAMHELRKAATDQIYRAHGIEAAVAFSGDTAKTIIKHYADTTTVGFRPKSIFDMIGA